MTFSEQRPDQRGAQALAWYAEQWENGGVEADDASVLLIADILAYGLREGEDPDDVATAALASLSYLEGGGDE